MKGKDEDIFARSEGIRTAEISKEELDITKVLLRNEHFPHILL